MPSLHIVIATSDVPASGRTQGDYRIRAMNSAFNIVLDYSGPDPFVPFPAVPVGDYTLLGQARDSTGANIGTEVSASYSYTGASPGPTVQAASGIGVQML